MTERNPNLDLLRCIAITMVALFHAINFAEPGYSALKTFSVAGALGVELFFVLSGFLIGGLFWREYDTFGGVRKRRFFLRRALRTVPPYLAGLLCAYLAVYLYRGQSFDWGYLLFLQNYYDVMPFFMVSWSLCVEEHFYLFAPICLTVLAMVCRNRHSTAVVIFCFLSLIPLVLRLLNYSETGYAFGYNTNATHFSLDGLVLGVMVSYIYYYKVWSLDGLRRYRYLVYTITFLAVVSSPYLHPGFKYTFGYYFLAWCFTLTVITAAAAKSPLLFARLFPRLTSNVAVTSYSTYLTHALVIHVMTRAYEFTSIENVGVRVFGMLIVIWFVGNVFYKVIEVPTFNLRSKLCPPRATESPRNDASSVA